MVVVNKDMYYFNVEAVKMKKTVLAPYKDKNGNNKDWTSDENGAYRMTHPSNVWFDITVPFWSMSENTDHPTQKPEKLYAKLILASTKSDDLVYEPFAGVCTGAVTAKKLNRNYIAVEREEEYALLGQKRINLAEFNSNIQGYEDGIFRDK
jgi:site-specific DNA-methyltransferase (adenine-specific)